MGGGGAEAAELADAAAEAAESADAAAEIEMDSCCGGCPSRIMWIWR